ncbi:MAG TPA: hypothetical protein VHG91_02540 [Longimicrobium sp.]|nr:hypothetical protein [Longimicrobium sp.]
MRPRRPLTTAALALALLGGAAACETATAPDFASNDEGRLGLPFDADPPSAPNDTSAFVPPDTVALP